MADNLETTLDNWPYEQIYPQQDEAIYDLLVAIETAFDQIDDDITYLHEQRLLQTATDRELEKLAAEVGITRETGESDEQLRFRTLIAKTSTRSNGTFEDLVGILYVLFEDDVSNISISAVDDEPTIHLEMPLGMIDDTPLTRLELSDALTDTIPLNDNITILTDDTLILGESGSRGLGGKLT